MYANYDINTFGNSPDQTVSQLQHRRMRQNSRGHHPSNSLNKRTNQQSGLNYAEYGLGQQQYSSSNYNQQHQQSQNSFKRGPGQNISIPDLKRQMQQALQLNNDNMFVSQPESRTSPNRNAFVTDNPAHRKTFTNNSVSNSAQKRNSYSRNQKSKSKSRQKNSKSNISQSGVHYKQKGTDNNYGKYPLDISIMKSDISLLSTQLYMDELPQNLIQLQFNVTDDILSLREQKLTLMENYNKVLQDRYRVERQLAKFRKDKDGKGRESGLANILESEKQSDLFPEGNPNVSSSSPKSKQDSERIIIRNEKLREQYQQLLRRNNTIQQQDQNSEQNKNSGHINEEIRNLRVQSQKIEGRLMDLQGRSQKLEEQRFETFFPQSNPSQPTGRVIATQRKQSKQLIDELEQLREIKNSLLINMSQSQPNSQMRGYFLELVNENKFLHQKADELLFKGSRAGKVSSDSNNNNTHLIEHIHRLRKQVSEQARAKQLFYEDLKKFKIQMNELKQENQRLSNYQ